MVMFLKDETFKKQTDFRCPNSNNYVEEDIVQSIKNESPKVIKEVKKRDKRKK